MGKEAIILGSKPGSVSALNYLLNAGWDVKEVVASKEHLNWIPKPSLYEMAKKYGIRTVEKQSELVTEKVDLVISYMFRKRVKPETLKIGRYALNFHAGPLPEFGGWAFYSIAILEEAEEYGCTCHIMDENFDTGELVKVRRFSICSKNETALSLERKSQKEMLLLFREIIDQYESQQILYSKPQDSNKMRYLNYEEFKKLKNIPLNSSSEYADKISRAFWYPPYDLAYYKLPNGTNIEVIPEIAKDEVAKSLHQDDYIISDLILNGRIPNLNKNY